jgi:hypothetical protein
MGESIELTRLVRHSSTRNNCVSISYEACFPGKKGRSPSQRFRYMGKGCSCEQEPSCMGGKALEKHRFRPMYAQANMGHPSRTIDRGSEIKFASFSLFGPQSLGGIEP